MAGNTVNGSRNGARSGALTLVVLTAPLTAPILRTLADGPAEQSALRRVAGSPAQTTLRAVLTRLAGIGAIEKRRRNRFPGVLEYELTATGRELLFVLDVIARWLDGAPDGPLALDGTAGKAAVKALVEGWSTTMLRALAARALALTELDGVIASLNYPSLERRLAAMRLAGLVEACPGGGRGTPYAVSGWLRRGVAPLAAAARWERRHLAQATAPIGRLDVEAAFLLSMPLVRAPLGLSGTCQLAAEVLNGAGRHLVGVRVEVAGGDVVSCSTELGGTQDAWVLGSPAAWLNAVVEHDTDRLEMGGDCSLAASLLDGLHGELFGAPSAIRP